MSKQICVHCNPGYRIRIIYSRELSQHCIIQRVIFNNSCIIKTEQKIHRSIDLDQRNINCEPRNYPLFPPHLGLQERTRGVVAACVEPIQDHDAIPSSAGNSAVPHALSHRPGGMRAQLGQG